MHDSSKWMNDQAYALLLCVSIVYYPPTRYEGVVRAAFGSLTVRSWSGAEDRAVCLLASNFTFRRPSTDFWLGS